MAADPFLLYLRGAGLPTPEPEFYFARPRKWRFDYAWPTLKLALEKEGGIYGRGEKCPLCGRRKVGAHSSINDMLRDMEKYNAAAILGWMVLRATVEEFNSGEVLTLLENAVARIYERSGIDEDHGNPGDV